jgi:hypothetical protein
MSNERNTTLRQFIDRGMARWIYSNRMPPAELIMRLTKYEISEQGVADIQAGRTWTSATRDLQAPARAA